MSEEKGIFRQKALDRLSSPERLDQLMRVSSPRDWIALLALGIVTVAAVAWSIMGELPTSVTGRGVLVQPSQVVDFQTLGTGRLEALYIKPGANVKKGDILGRLDQTETRKRLEEDRILLADLQAQDRAKGTLQNQQTQLQEQQLVSQRSFLQMQQQSLEKSMQDALRLAPVLKKRFETLENLRKQGLLAEVSSDMVQAEQALLENEFKLTDLNARAQQIEGQLKQLDLDVNEVKRDTLENATARRNQIQELRSRIALNEIQLARNSDIISEHTGKILEVIASVGQVLPTAARIATVELDGPADTLVAVAYFPIRDGKKIQPGMPVQITPDTVERQRYGGIIGTVVSVSTLPVTKEGALALVGNAEVVQGLMQGGPFISVTAELQRSPSTFSGFAWSSSSGPTLQMSAGLTGMVRATIEQRAPITYVLPFLRSLSGIY